MVTKKQLISELSSVVKTVVQEQKNGNDNVLSDSVNAVCSILEAIFIQGLREAYVNRDVKHGDKYPEPNFWPFIQKFTHRNVRAQIGNLNQIKTEIGKARVWLRIALNDGLLENYINSIAREPQIVRHYYHRHAFLRDQEQIEVAANYARALSKFTFKAPVNSNMLNFWTPTPLTMAGLLEDHSVPTALVENEEEEAVSALEFEGLEDTHMASDTQSDSASVVFSTVSPKSAPGFKAFADQSVFSDGDSVFSSTPSGITPETETSQELRLQYVLDSLVDKNAMLPEWSTTSLEQKPQEASPPPPPETVDSPANDEHFEQSQAESLTPDDEEAQQESESSSKEFREPSVDGELEFSFSPGNSLLGRSGWSSSHFPETEDIETTEETTETMSPSQSDFSSTLQQVLQATVLKHDSSLEQIKNEAANPVEESFEDDSTVVEHTTVKESVTSDYVVVENAAPAVEPAEKAFRLSFLTKFGDEIGLNGQDYKCNSCRRSIGLMFGTYRLCTFDGRYYCSECHLNEESVIPARILYNWDLKSRKVCRASKAFLDHVADQPLIRLSLSNPTLTDVVEKVKEVRNLRLQLSYVAMYLLACRELVADDLRKRIWPKEYLYQDVDLYSAMDLVLTSSGQLQKHLKSVISFAMKHVLDTCRLCASKGFVCEICGDPKIIYPFQVDLSQRCGKCYSVYHKNCADGRPCPKCLRREMNSKSALDSGIEMPPFGDA